MVAAQLVERLLPIPEVRGSNPVIGKNLFILNICLLSTVYWEDENKEKEAGYGPFLKKTLLVKSYIKNWNWGRGGQVVSVLPFYSDNPSSSLAEAYSFFCINCIWKRTKINRKRSGLAHLFFKKEVKFDFKISDLTRYRQFAK